MAKRGWGGRRHGAGRRPRHAIASEPHRARRRFDGPRTVTAQLRLVSALSRKTIDPVVRAAVAKANARPDFRVVSYSVASRAIELVVEVANQTALSRGVQGFEVSVARAVNRTVHRQGQVFADRYRLAQ